MEDLLTLIVSHNSNLPSCHKKGYDSSSVAMSDMLFNFCHSQTEYRSHRWVQINFIL